MKSLLPFGKLAIKGGTGREQGKTRVEGKNGGKKCKTDALAAYETGLGVSLIYHWYFFYFFKGKRGKNTEYPEYFLVCNNTDEHRKQGNTGKDAETSRFCSLFSLTEERGVARLKPVGDGRRVERKSGRRIINVFSLPEFFPCSLGWWRDGRETHRR